MPKLNTITQISKGQKVLIYGPPKSGKTYLAGSLAEAGFELIDFDIEFGAVTLLNQLSEEAKSRVQLIQIPDTKEVPRAAETISQFFRHAVMSPGRPFEVCVAHGRVNCPDCKAKKAEFDVVEISKFTNKTVVMIDSLSQLSDSAMAVYTKDVQGFDLNDKLGEYSRVEFKHFDAQGRLLLAILSAIQAAGFHILVISHEVSIETEDGKEMIVPRCGTKNISKLVSKYFDHVIYCTTMNRKHIQQSSTLDSNKHLIGSRSNLSMKDGATLADLLNGKIEKLEKK